MSPKSSVGTAIVPSTQYPVPLVGVGYMGSGRLPNGIK